MAVKHKIAMLLAELIGTAVLTMVVLSVRSSGIGYSFFVAIGAGIAVTALVMAFGAISGGHFNPALTFGLWTARKVKTAPAIVYLAMQFLGGAIAYWLYIYLVKTHLQSTAGHYSGRILLAEAIGTFIFVLGWAEAAARGYIGLKFAAAAGGAFAIGIMVAALASNGIVNPAIALGQRSFGWSTYVAGPAIGGLVAANLHAYVLADRIKTAGAVARGDTRPASGATAATTSTRKSSKSTRRGKK